MAPTILTLTSSRWYDAFRWLALQRAAKLLWVCRLKPASSKKTQFLLKSKSCIFSHSSILSFLSLITQSVFRAAGNVSSFFNVFLHLWTKCLCRAEVVMDNPWNVSQNFAVVSASGYDEYLSMKSIRNRVCASVSLPECSIIGSLWQVGSRRSSSSLYFT